jgi:RNA polymerase sigma-70 factor (ECF subfamily)
VLLNRNKYGSFSDAELIHSFKQRQRNAIIGELYTRYGHLVMGTAMKYMKNVQEAEDLTMEVFEGLAVKIVKHEIKHFKSWLYMVCRNECLMRLRKKGPVAQEIEDKLTAEEEDDTAYVKEEQLNRLEKAIDELKDLQRMCIKHFYLDQKSYQEIALELNISIKKVKSAIQNGKRNLKIMMEGSHEQ